MPKISGKVAIVLSVTDAARSTAWYVDVFRMDTISEFEGLGIKQICLREPTSGLEVCLITHSKAEGEGLPFSEFLTGLDHLEILVADRSDLDEWSTHLDTLEIAHSGVKEPPHSRNAMLTFRDPDNIQLELFWASR